MVDKNLQINPRHKIKTDNLHALVVLYYKKILTHADPFNTAFEISVVRPLYKIQRETQNEELEKRKKVNF